MENQSSFFKDLKVIELASVLAGPSVGQFFAELGAEVIKVENPKTNGDVTRSWKGANENTDDISAYFACINWGKKSLALDITKSEGLEVLYKLVEGADIVITSYKPGDDKKLKVDYASLKHINDDLIYGQITGYGSLAERVGYDAIIQAEVGFMNMNGEEGGEPTKMPVAMMDLLAGHQLKEALLLGYINKLKTGKGSYFQVSLIEAGLASLANQATNYMVAKAEPKRKGSKHPNIAPYGELFKTMDDKQIILAIGSDQQFSKLLSVLDLELKENFSSNVLRVTNRDELYSYLKDSFLRFTSSDLMNSFNEKNIPAGIVNKVSEAIDLYGELIKLESNKLQGLKTFIANSGQLKNSSHILPPPHLGQHTQEILKSLEQKGS
ncbi:CaiB/BaiF CoA transferase family protein [Fulvivirga lutea]|uniref:CoA transferase n=1 Tax=Fulvivirga lutea TaxID=2810512 RepID=A0A975A242_9BACT|nr:CaiB/BaiF CoA-transferase family protein [Fulvivirga lutea]QSE99036.1 CoA transferase [Fulvivirga lutea]